MATTPQSLPTRHAGLSLGDRACLALAIDLDGDAYTLDGISASVTCDVKIHLLR